MNKLVSGCAPLTHESNITELIYIQHGGRSSPSLAFPQNMIETPTFVLFMTGSG